jgi:hypothetical protein
LKQACVVPENKMAFCFLELADGKNVLEEIPLTEVEIAAYRDHPDTFFGRYDRSATGPLRDPLDLYDWIYESFSGASKEQLLENLKDAEDIAELKNLPHKDLLSIYCERLVYGFLATENKPVG